MIARRPLLASVAALVLGVPAIGGAAPVSGKTNGLLVPLGPSDTNAFARELPGENMGDGGEFSIGRNRFVRLEGRHLTFKTASGVKTCVVTPAQAQAWTFGDTGRIGCGDISLAKSPDHRVKSDLGQPVVLTVSQGARTAKLNGLWQGLE